MNLIYENLSDVQQNVSDYKVRKQTIVPSCPVFLIYIICVVRLCLLIFCIIPEKKTFNLHRLRSIIWEDVVRKLYYTVAGVSISLPIMAIFKVGYTVLGYQPENAGKHADVSTVMHWSSSGRRSRNGNASFLWPYITFTVTGVRGIRGKSISGCPVGPAFLSSQGSHPASRELKSYVSVEAFPIKGHVEVDGFLEQQFTGVSSHVNHCDLIPLDGMLVLPCMFSYCKRLQCPFLQASWCSLNLISNLLLVSPM